MSKVKKLSELKENILERVRIFDDVINNDKENVGSWKQIEKDLTVLEEECKNNEITFLQNCVFKQNEFLKLISKLFILKQKTVPYLKMFNH